MTERLPFNAFCWDVFSGGGKCSVRSWAERLGCREPDIVNWCLGNGVPSEADLIRIHFAVMDARDLPHEVKACWLQILDLPVPLAMRMPRLLRLPGDEPDADAHLVTVGHALERHLLEEIGRRSDKIPTGHYLALLRRFAEHAAVAARYHAKG